MTPVDILFQQLKEVVYKYNPEVNWPLVEKAYHFAAQAHKDQRRRSGEPYIVHPVHAAMNLAKLNMDSSAICAGLLHDVLEDTDVSSEDLRREFGDDVTYLVEGVSKLEEVKFTKKNQYIENLRKMFIATAKDIRVLLIRLCDRLHNVQTLEFLPTKEQKRIAQETLEIYAPIAHRLQLGALKGQLEDWSFKYIDPKEYERLLDIIQTNFKERQQSLRMVKDTIKQMMHDNHIEVIDMKDRIKNVYSLHKKLERYDNELSSIYDIVALRVVVPSIADCYAGLGIVHSTYKPLKGRIKDYIARPKPNGYQSLHTTVLLNNGDFLEIQFRTPKMHEQAEFGIAAHWQYKEGDQYPRRQKEIQWIKELAGILKDIETNNDLESVKIESFSNRIFTLTPKGDVIELPENSTAIDFAYSIHTDLGDKIIKAKINGEIKNVDTILQNGDVVEVIIDKNKKGPDIKWIDKVQTQIAKSKIQQAHRRKLFSWGKDLKNVKAN